jgi:hypothetical protein
VFLHLVGYADHVVHSGVSRVRNINALFSCLGGLDADFKKVCWVLAVLNPNRIICKRMDANCSRFHLRVFHGLSNQQGLRQTRTISIPRCNFGERKAKPNLEMSRTTQMQLYKCIHIP